MILPSSMTVKEALDQVMRRVSQLQTRSNLDYKIAWNFLNNARREVFARTLPFKDYAYTKTIAISNATALPADFTRVVRVILKDPADTKYVSARRAAAKEWWRVSNTLRPDSRIAATRRYPAYTVWGSEDDFQDDAQYIYTAPSNETGYLEYVAAYSDLPLDVNGEPDLTATLNIPLEFENIVIQSTLVRCFSKMAERELLADTMRRTQMEYAKLGLLYVAKGVTSAVNAESLTNPEPVTVPDTNLQPRAQGDQNG